MPCFAILLALISPRLALIIIWLFGDWLGRAYDSWLLPVIGFFLIPWTTFAYALMWNTGGRGVEGFDWFIVGFAFLLDVGSYAGGARGVR